MHLFSIFLAQMEPHNFQCIFCNSFIVFYLNTYVCYQNPSNKNKDNVELRFEQRCDMFNSANSTCISIKYACFDDPI